MRIYSNRDGQEYTALGLIETAEESVHAMTGESAAQLRGDAVRGRPLVVGIDAWDRWAFDGEGGICVYLRVRGIAGRHASAMLNTRGDAESLLNEVEALLDGRAVPVPGEVSAGPREFLIREARDPAEAVRGIPLFADDLEEAKRRVAAMQMFTNTVMIITATDGVRLSVRCNGTWHDVEGVDDAP